MPLRGLEDVVAWWQGVKTEEVEKNMICSILDAHRSRTNYIMCLDQWLILIGVVSGAGEILRSSTVGFNGVLAFPNDFMTQILGNITHLRKAPAT